MVFYVGMILASFGMCLW